MILICAPKFDEATKITHDYAEAIRKYADWKGRSHKLLEKEDAIPRKVLRELKVSDSFMFFDHGSYSALYGQDETELITIGNADELSNITVDVTACKSARDLGPKAVDKNCIAYLGYDGVVFVDESEETKEIMNTSKRALLDGITAKEAYDQQVEAYEEGTRRFVVQNRLIGEFHMWNRLHFRLIQL